MFGSHLSIAGGMVNALIEAQSLKFDCVQVFTKNQRQWKAKPLDDADRQAWLDMLRELGWQSTTRRGATISHNSYLINLASPEKALWKKSLDLQREEMIRCEALDIPFLVAHPGAHRGDAPRAGTPHTLRAAPTSDELAGMKRIAKALDRLHRDLEGFGVVTCIETTVGSGSNLGYDFGHLAKIRNLTRDPDRVAFCFDTCHVTAAGYDMSTDETASAVLEEWDDLVGLDELRVIHVNDSVGEIGSRRDRHAHIGHGNCGLSCFRAIVNHPQLRDVPKILETPKEEDGKGTPWDVRNIRKLKRLVRRSSSH